MAKRIVIAGAGGFGRGVLAWLADSPNHLEREQIDELVFIDDGTPEVPPDAPVITRIAEYVPEDRDELLCAIAAPQSRRKIVRMLAAKGAKFHTFVADQTVVAPNTRIGAGSIVCPGTAISAHAHLSPHVHVNFNCSIGHDTIIRELATLSPAVNVMGGVTIGSGTLLGGSAVVLPGLKVGDAATVGAGSVVVSEVASGATVVGNPAKARPHRIGNHRG